MTNEENRPKQDRTTTDAEASRTALLCVASLIAATANEGKPDTKTDDEKACAIHEATSEMYATEYESAGGSFHQGWGVDLDAAFPSNLRSGSVCLHLLVTSQLLRSVPVCFTSTLDRTFLDLQPFGPPGPPFSERTDRWEFRFPCQSIFRQEFGRETLSAGDVYCVGKRRNQRASGSHSQNQDYSKRATDV